MCYLGISPCVCKLREHKFWTFQVKTGHANLSPGQTTPFHHRHNHRGTTGWGGRRATCCCRNTEIRMRTSDWVSVTNTFSLFTSVFGQWGACRVWACWPCWTRGPSVSQGAIKAVEGWAARGQWTDWWVYQSVALVELTYNNTRRRRSISVPRERQVTTLTDV